MTARAVAVVDPGLLTLVQDLGRPGWAHVGVGRAGAADAAALRRANRAVGNDDGAAGLEVLLGGLRVRALAAVDVALAGAYVAVTVERAGGAVERDGARRVRLGAGDVLALGRPERGLRTYVAFAGGLAVEPVLGSRASDRLGGIGPAPVAAGDVLPVGPPPPGPPPAGLPPTWPADEPDAPADDQRDVPVLRVEIGPHAHWFTPRWPGVLCAPEGYVVAPSSDRVAVRLDGPQIPRTAQALGRELAPVGLVPGAVQVPPDGRPVVFGVDHPVTGGYPVLAVVRSSDLDLLAQVRPGDVVRLALALSTGR
ncbi:5-oxoprolinase subunit C family protein [Cellulomonas palmilytica]|uniref:5-oxoprolinase subunit C family protein n=1 Tax=Cellulomonas palmilytica TaxID=2608402 RepID=UPI001F2DB88F|nr:allophanate hydrolase subunit 2 family protein [Cellulomonas palmilytica]UJP39944.1 biotin-dependent carboxyltransferase family protein [Cellulomonas palmilytica]